MHLKAFPLLNAFKWHFRFYGRWRWQDKLERNTVIDNLFKKVCQLRYLISVLETVF